MGSYTEFNGVLKVNDGTLTKEIWEEFTRGFGYAHTSKLTRKSQSPVVDGIVTDTHYSKLVFTGSWKTDDFAVDIKEYLVFFANRGVFFKGRIHCKHEYGDLYAVDVNGKYVETLEGHIEYATPVKANGYSLQEKVTYQ